jgi:hypothetical protein
MEANSFALGRIVLSRGRTEAAHWRLDLCPLLPEQWQERLGNTIETEEDNFRSPTGNRKRVERGSES